MLSSAEDLRAFARRSNRHVQAKGLNVNYLLVDECGPDHAKTFKVCAEIDGKRYDIAEGTSKKKAEQEAAKIAYEELIKNL